MSETVRLLQDLIRCPSVTPADAGAIGVLEDYLTAAGFSCTRLTFGKIENLFARIGTGAPHFCFAGHTDVVPPGDESRWTHAPFSGDIADGYVWGRGATDMKGSVAAFAVAAAEFVKAGGLPGSISLLITGDEEAEAVDGTVKVLQWMRQTDQVPDHCLVGEPSCPEQFGDMIKIGRRGSISFTVKVTGRQGHSAYPHKADNPVPKLARFIDRIAAAELDQGTDEFDPSTLAVTTFDVGNRAGNVIPGEAVARFNIRYNTRHTPQSLRDWVAAQAAAVEKELGGSFAVSASEGADVFITRPGPFTALVQKAVTAESNLVPVLSTSGGTSDARFIKDYCPVVEFGPTNATIHQTDERIAVSELERLTSVYGRILRDYFAERPR